MTDPNEALVRKVRELPEPREFFRGAMTPAPELPQNLILFQRSRPSQLGKDHHYHFRFVLLANFRRAGVVALDQRNLAFKPGEAILIFPHQFHHFLETEAEDIRWLFMTFELQRAEAFSGLKYQVRALSPTCYVYLSHLLDAYVRTLPAAGPVSPALGLLAALVLQELAQQEGVSPPAPSLAQPTVVDRICRHVWDHFGENLGLESLAREFCYSESHLRLLFRQHMGMSLGSYIQRIRMNRARSSLVGTEKNVSEVAQECGYDSLYSFSRTFKKTTGLSPLAYRKLNLGRG